MKYIVPYEKNYHFCGKALSHPPASDTRSKFLLALSAIISAIASEEVAAGEGALRTCKGPPSWFTTKSSTRVPLGARAWARTPAGPGRRSDELRSGMWRCRSLRKAALLKSLYISARPKRQYLRASLRKP